MHGKLRLAVKFTLATVLEEEVEAYIQAGRYEQNEQRRYQRNGYYTRNLSTTMGVVEELSVPRTRKGYRMQLFQRYKRRQRKLDEAMAGMFIGGVSNEQTSQLVTALTGKLTSGKIAYRVFQGLRLEYEQWWSRALASHYLYAFADGSYFNVIYDGERCKMPILAVLGINPQGEKEILGFTFGDKENQPTEEKLMTALKDRGVQQVDLWITDCHQAMINAIESQFPTARQQRCVVHNRLYLGSTARHSQTGTQSHLLPSEPQRGRHRTRSVL